MKAKYIFSIVALALGLTACDNYFDEKYMDNGAPVISEVKTFEYTLRSSDYASIANSAVNKIIAAEQDSMHGLKNRYQNALARVGEQGYFNTYASADMYVPAFLKNKSPHFDEGSVYNVTYMVDDGLPQYLVPFNNATRVELNITDESLIPSLLPQPDEGQVIGVRYDNKEVLYESVDGYEWTPCVFPAGVEMYLLPVEANGQVGNWLRSNYPYAEVEQWVVVVMFDETQNHYTAYEYTFDGSEWKANTGIVEESMRFELKADNKWETDLSTYYRQVLVGESSMGQIKVFAYDLEDGITYVWRLDEKYGMRGSTYAGSAHYGEGWFVTPKIKLKKSVSPALIFDQAVNKAGEQRFEQLTVWVSTDFKDDARKATWTQLPWNQNENGDYVFPDGTSWDFMSSGRMDLSAWNGQSIHIGFRYKTGPGEQCPTWEVQNIVVNEPEEDAANAQ